MELDIERFDSLHDYLADHGYEKPGETISLETLAGGVSNRTVKLQWADGRSWVLKQALRKLRVNADWFSSPDRIRVEAKALRWLNCSAPPGTTPGFVFEDLENHLMAMQAIPEGHQNWKSVLLSGRIIPDHFEQFGLLLGTIHRHSSESRPRNIERICQHSLLREPPPGTVLPLCCAQHRRSGGVSQFAGTGDAPPQRQSGSWRFQPEEYAHLPQQIDLARLRSGSLRRPGF